MTFNKHITFDSQEAYEHFQMSSGSEQARDITDLSLIGPINEASWISRFTNLVALTVETDKIIEISDFSTSKLRFLDLNRQGLMSMRRFWDLPLHLEGFSLRNAAKSGQELGKLQWRARSLALSGPSESSFDFPQIGSVSSLKLARTSRDVSLAHLAKAENLQKLLLIGLKGRVTGLQDLSSCKALTEIGISGVTWQPDFEEITKLPCLRNVAFVNVKKLPHFVLAELAARGVVVEVI